MKKHILNILVSSILMMTLLASCSFLEVGSPKEEPVTISTESQRVKVSGSLGNTLSRAAIPSMPSGTYYVTASDGSGTTVTGDVDQTACTYEISLSAAKSWTLEAGLKDTDNTILLKQSGVELTRIKLAGKETYPLSFTLAPVTTTTGKGSVSLSVILPSSNYELKVECIDTNLAASWGQTETLTPTTDNDGNQVVTISKSNLKSGTYKVMLSLQGANYSTLQYINVFDGMETNKWIEGSSNLDPTVTDGKLQITENNINKYSQHVFYVGTVGSNEGSDTSGEGSPYKPFKTIAKAVSMMSDSNVDYTIYVSGMLGRSHDSDGLAAGQCIAEVEAIEITTDLGNKSYGWQSTGTIAAKSITLKGLNPLVNGEPVDGIDGEFSAATNGKSTPVLLVATSVPVIIENLKLSGGWSKSGEALAVGFSRALIDEDNSTTISADVTIKNGVLITDNGKGPKDSPCPMFAPIVRILNDGSILKMEDGSITDNISGSGLISVGRGAIFEMTGGSITGNTLYEDASTPEKSISCGVYVVAPADDGSLAAGTFKISDDAIVDEVYLGTGAVVTVSGELTNNTPIKILPSAYTDGTQVVAVADDSGVSLADACEYFTVRPYSGVAQISSTGTLLEGYISLSEFDNALTSLKANTASTPYNMIITDSISDFATTNESHKSALDTAGKYVTLSFNNASFTSMSGTLSEYITSLTIPNSVTTSGMGFLDLGENFTGFVVPSGNTKFSVSNKTLYSYDGKKIYRVAPTYTGTSYSISSSITSIADGAFVGCKNIEKFTVASGNNYFKTQDTTWVSSYSGLVAYQELMHFEKDDSIGDEPTFDLTSGSDWNIWNKKVQNQWGHCHYAPLPVLLSYDGSTIVACPPALKLVTRADLMTAYPSDGAVLGGSSVSESNYTTGIPEFTCTTVRPYAFGKCNTLTDASVKITSTTATSAYLFYKCPELTYVSLNIPSTDIIAYSFTDCTKLGEVKFSNTSTTEIKTNAFAGCTALKKLWFAAGRGNGSCEEGAYPSTCTVTLDGQVN